MRTVHLLNGEKALPKVLGKSFEKSEPFQASLDEALVWKYDFSTGLNDAVSGDAVTVTRAGGALYRKDDGTYPTIAANEAKLTGSGLRIEQAHTNEWLYSQDLTNANWANFNTTDALETVSNPIDGLTQVTAVTSTSTANAEIGKVAGSGSGLRCYSGMFKKKTGADYVYLLVSDAATQDVRQWVSLVDGSTGSKSQTGSQIDVSRVEVFDDGDGWYRVNIVILSNVASAIGRWGLATSDASTAVGNGDAVYMTQLDNQPERLCLSPVKTEGSTATTNLDVPTFTRGSETPLNDYQIYFKIDLNEAVGAINQTVFDTRSLSTDGDTFYFDTNKDFHWSRKANSSSTSLILAGTATSQEYEGLLTMSSTSGMTLEIDGVGTTTNAVTTSFIGAPAATSYLGQDFTGGAPLDSVLQSFKCRAGTDKTLAEMRAL